MAVNVEDQVINDRYALYQGDSCQVIAGIPDDSIHFGIHSPPFAGLYQFSAFDEDISNNDEARFFEHYAFLVRELLRVCKPGRLHSVHVMQLPMSKTRHGHIGMRDFRGEVVKLYQDAGWIFHSEVCIWKDPVVAQQRTKSIRLLHKQVVKDSALSGQGLADYIVTFRKPGMNDEPIQGEFEFWIGAEPDSAEWGAWGSGIDVSREAYAVHGAKVSKPWPFETWRSVLIWQRFASPVWMDINQTRTLQYRNARDDADERHISPLQLDVIERCIELWSNEGDTVLTPFLGIGSEIYGAVEMGRKGIGIELKPSYFAQAVKNLATCGVRNPGLFDAA